MKTKFNVIYFFALTFSFFSCRSINVNVFPDSYDLKLGAQFNSEIQANTKEYPILKGRDDVKQYITIIGNKILSSPEIKKRNEFIWKFDIIDDDKTINAFSVPGGYIYVYTGLLKYIDDEATLAGIIAHEIAHAEKRHATRRVTSQMGLQLGASVASELLLGEDAATWQKSVVPVLSNMLVTGVVMFNSREDEYEADEMSFKYLKTSEYYPAAIKSFFEKVNDKKEKDSGFGATVSQLFSTHPLPPDRLEKMNQFIKEGNYPPPGENNLFSKRYQKFRSSLK
jgi:predicted Zn-dependent protease